MRPDRDRFAEKLRRALVRAGVVEDPRYDSERFVLQHQDGALYLTNAYDEYCRASFFTRGGVVRRWVASLKAERAHRTPETFAEAQGNLLPFVRDEAYFDYVRLMQRSEPGLKVPALPTRALGGGLAVALAYDSPTAIATLTQKTLDDWGVSLDDALKPAQFNLRARTPHGLARHSPGVFVSPYLDNHDAARIVLTELITRLEVRGDPVAFAPHRDSLIVTGSDDPDGLAQACALAEPLVKENRRISGCAVVFRNGDWQPFFPAPGTAAHESFRRLRLLALLADYGQQAELLQKLEGENVFVASFQVIDADGTWFSYSVWSDGVPTSLPLTDRIFLRSDRFPEGDPRAGLKEFAAVERIAGGLMEKQDFKPGRVMVRRFPTDEMMKQL